MNEVSLQLFKALDIHEVGVIVFWEEFPSFNETVSSMISLTLNCQTTYFIDENVEIVP